MKFIIKFQFFQKISKFAAIMPLRKLGNFIYILIKLSYEIKKLRE